MHRRLIVGCAAASIDAVTQIAQLPGETTIISRRREVTERCADLDVRCVRRDPTDASEYPESVDTVICAARDTERNHSLVQAVHDRYPSAPVIVIGGEHDGSEAAVGIEATADRWVRGGPSVVSAVEAVLGLSEPSRAVRLMRLLRATPGPMAVLMHATPDPDAIASALAMVTLADRVGLTAEACHFGELSHQENRALVNLLEIDLHPISEPEELRAYASIALVDHTRLPAAVGEEIVAVVDHHAVREPISASFIDIDPAVGATSTIMAGYLRDLSIAPASDLASALTVGIRTDTGDFTREVDARDLEIAGWLSRWSDHALLDRVETPAMQAEMLDVLARAATHRQSVGPVLLAAVGEVHERDALAQTADHLLMLEGTDVVIVYGYTDAAVLVSARARGAVDVGHLLQDAFGPVGSAGGHEDMAGAQVRWGIMQDGLERDADERWEIAEKIVAGRIVETLDDAGRVATTAPGELTLERWAGR
jgi:nanoRNase/pAp phosphatase (c-di-AMP/oligoRNAs hydrolase)